MTYTHLIGINLAFVLAMAAMGLLVDLNGRLPACGPGLSAVVQAAVVMLAFLAAGLLIARSHGSRRLLGIAVMLLYFVLLVPMIASLCPF